MKTNREENVICHLLLKLWPLGPALAGQPLAGAAVNSFLAASATIFLPCWARVKLAL